MYTTVGASTCPKGGANFGVGWCQGGGRRHDIFIVVEDLWMWICMRPFSICATREIRSRRLQKPSPVYHLAVGTWNEQEGVRHRMSSKGEFANWNMRTKFFFIWWNPPPVLLYRATRSVRFHIHYDYLVACLLLPPSNSARRTGRIHTHTNKRIDWLTTTQPSEKRIVWRDRDLFQ